MRVNVEGEQVQIDLSPAELHVVHTALHSYGDHELAGTLERDAHRMSDEFRQQLDAVKRWAVDAAETLETQCSQAFSHADGKSPDE